MRSGNPVLRDDMFSNSNYNSDGTLNVPSYADLADSAERPGTMTIRGTAIKAAFLLALCVISAVVSWSMIESGKAPAGLVMVVGGVGGLVISLVLMFWQKGAAFLSPIYALCQGAFIGGISLMAATVGLGRGQNAIQLEGVYQAMFMTFGIFAAMLLLYGGRILKATPAFTKMVVAGTIGVALAYLGTMLLRLFGMDMPYIHNAGPIGIGFSVLCVALASFNLVLDFDFIESGSKAGAPKHMEWFGAFGLLVTLVWLYIELLRLLSKLRSQN
jgi:uncharacterized YccA/Bax inhibitor family protein